MKYRIHLLFIEFDSMEIRFFLIADISNSSSSVHLIIFRHTVNLITIYVILQIIQTDMKYMKDSPQLKLLQKLPMKVFNTC